MPITIKGTPQGLLLIPGETPWDETLQALEHSLRNAADFFRGGRVILELDGRALSEADLISLRTLLERYEITLWVIRGGDEATERLVRAYGIRTRTPGEAQRATQEPAIEPLPDAANAPPPAALFIQRTLRSGQSLDFPGDITLLGDLNPGAEIISGGSILVWGRARGVLHAGALGDENALICALDLDPSQLRIAGLISRAPEGKRRRSEPEVARIENNMIIVEPWTVRG